MNHFKPVSVAVALNWDGQRAPRVTAKGRGELAERIVASAREHGVPLDDDPVLVEILAAVDLGAEIPETMFAAVAEVIAFAYSLHDQLPAHMDSHVRPSEPRTPGQEPHVDRRR